MGLLLLNSLLALLGKVAEATLTFYRAEKFRKISSYTMCVKPTASLFIDCVDDSDMDSTINLLNHLPEVLPGR